MKIKPILNTDPKKICAVLIDGKPFEDEEPVDTPRLYLRAQGNKWELLLDNKICTTAPLWLCAADIKEYWAKQGYSATFLYEGDKVEIEF
jgi:hypothetical protein